MRYTPLRLLFVVAVSLTSFGLLAAATPMLHLRLVKAEPAVDGVVTAPPTTIRLYFSEAPQVRLTSVTLTSASNEEIAVGDAAADKSDATMVSAPIAGAVTPGAYTVSWRTMAKDGHVVRGEFGFTVRAAQ